MANLIDKEFQPIWSAHSISHKLSTETLEQYTKELNNLFVLIPKTFTELTESDIMTCDSHFRTKIAEALLKPSTVFKKVKIYSSYANYIVDKELIPGYENPFTPLVRAYSSYQPQKIDPAKITDLDSIDKLLVAARDEISIFTSLALMLRLGLTVQNICDLRIDSLDLEKRDLLIVPPKNKIIFLPDDVKMILQIYMASRTDWEKMNNAMGLHYDELFLRNKTHKPFERHHLKRKIKFYCEQANIPSTCLRDLRSSSAAQIFASGGSISNIAEFLHISEKDALRYKINIPDPTKRNTDFSIIEIKNM